MHGSVVGGFARWARDRHGRGPTAEGGDAFDATAVYPDEVLIELVGELARETRTAPDDILRGFGEFAGADLFREWFPSYYDLHRDTAGFLLGVEETIHEIVRGSVDGAAPPRLRVAPLSGYGVVVSYTSERKLCALLEGLVRGVATRYGEAVELSHDTCMLRGEPACSVVVAISRP